MTNTVTNPPAITGLQPLQEFNKVIANRENGTSELSDSWHFLQLYSYWGLFLPNTEDALKLKLGTTSPGSFTFFTPMLTAYILIHDASSDFVKNVFNKVVGLGNDLKSFAEKASTQHPDASIFSAVLQCLDEDDSDSALELLTDLQQSAAANAEASVEVRDLLGAYKAKLASASGKLTAIKTTIDSDQATSAATIKRLSGDAAADGSLAQYESLINQSDERYKHYVVVASTTVTYAWVVPFGLVAASVVAGVYGDRAVKELKASDKLRADLKAKKDELSLALTTREVQNLAQTGVSQALALTDSAIQHTTVLQNAWNKLDAELQTILRYLADSTRTVDGETFLKSKMVVRTYLNSAGKAWAGAVPALEQLTRNPYITVSPREVTLTEMANNIQKAIDQQP